MTTKIKYPPVVIRLFDSIIPIFSWLIITLPIWLSPFHPAVVAYFIIGFNLYFLYKAIKVTYLAAISYQKIIINNQINFEKKLKKIKPAVKLYHIVVIPNYQEPLYKLVSTISAITQSQLSSRQIILVLAFEKRDPSARQKEKVLRQQFNNQFDQIIASYHPLLPNEVPGKASNQTYALKKVSALLKSKRIPPKRTLITICDADSHLPTNYFSYLSYQFLTDSDSLYHFYWGAVLLYNNFWQLPLFVRIQATLSSIIRLAYLSWGDNLIQISTYSTNLWLLQQLNYWDVDIIPEDWHIYLQALFRFGKRVKTLPLYTIINGDAVYSGKLIKTLINRYEQEKRWAWGVSDISYALVMSFTTNILPVREKIKKLLFLIETHLLWPVSFFILTISASIPPLINPVFKRTVLGFLLPQMAGLILTFCSVLLLIYIFIDIRLRQRLNQHTHIAALPILIIQWYLLPLVSFVLSSLPALDAQTRLLFGKKIQYKVTEKV